MAIKKTFWCDECGEIFNSANDAATHERIVACMPYKVGDPVWFKYDLLTYPAKVTDTGKKVELGKKRVIYVQTEEKIEEPEDIFHTGKDFFTELSGVSRREVLPCLA